jgi:hypothetical protein
MLGVMPFFTLIFIYNKYKFFKRTFYSFLQVLIFHKAPCSLNSEPWEKKVVFVHY